MTAAFFFQAPSGGLGSLIFLFLPMFAIMYLLVFRPQQKQRKQHQAMIEALKAGDKVLTSGGIYGTINGIDGDTVILKISSEPQVKVRVARTAISQVEAPEDAK